MKLRIRSLVVENVRQLRESVFNDGLRCVAGLVSQLMAIVDFPLCDGEFQERSQDRGEKGDEKDACQKGGASCADGDSLFRIHC